MANQSSPSPHYFFQRMSAIEKQVWGTILALHIGDGDAGVSAADAALRRLRDVLFTREALPEPEDEAARARYPIEADAFAVWYAIQYRNIHAADDDFRERTDEDIRAAYVRFLWNRSDPS
jgi:hypothetical protein